MTSDIRQPALAAGPVPDGASPAGVARSRTEQAAAALTDLVTLGPFSPGEFLPSEAELCRRLGVSRATVREALRKLEARGLVASRHGVGIQVADGTGQAVADTIGLLLRRRGVGPRDMLEVRLMLECQAAALAARRATAADLSAIGGAIAAMGGAGSGTDERVAADLDFHLRVAEASKNEVLAALEHALRGLLRDTIAATFAIDPNVDERIEAHRRILGAIAGGDAVGAEGAMRAHLLKTEELVRLGESDDLGGNGGDAAPSNQA